MNKNFIEGESPVDNLKLLLKTMRVTLCFLFLSVMLSQAATGYSQETKLNINLKSASIQAILSEIESESDFRFVFDSNARKIIGKRVTLSDNSQNIKDILDEILSATGLTYKILDNQVVVYQAEVMPTTAEIVNIVAQIEQQKKKITGNITDQAGEAIIGANIIEVGTTNGTVTDINGNFSLDVEDDATLHVSYIGYLEQTINTSGRTSINIVLVEDTKALDELVVIGYGTVRRGDVTTAVSTVSLDDLNERPIVSAAQAIQGKAAGVNVYRPSGTPGGEMVVRVRGTTLFPANTGSLNYNGQTRLLLLYSHQELRSYLRQYRTWKTFQPMSFPLLKAVYVYSSSSLPIFRLEN